MTNKYYTPELSEFYVGFEYEVKEMCSINKGPRQIQWNKQIVNGLGSTELHWRISSYPEEIRVKYLSKQDLEDCGFEVQHVEQDGDIIYFEQIGKPHNQIVFHKYSGIHYKNGKYGDGFITLNIPKRLSGNIYIKNKSELKKLLKQLGR